MLTMCPLAKSVFRGLNCLRTGVLKNAIHQISKLYAFRLQKGIFEKTQDSDKKKSTIFSIYILSREPMVGANFDPKKLICTILERYTGERTMLHCKRSRQGEFRQGDF